MKTLIALLLSCALALAVDPELEAFAATTQQFSAAVYDEILVDNSDNILVSPFSAETILALTQSGASGTTAKEIRATLSLPATETATEALIKKVLPTFKNHGYVLHTANKVYVENHFPIKERFKRVVTDVYDAAFENVEFAQSAAAVEEINQWVEEQTEDKIRDLLSPEDVDASTSLVLVNALYFQGNWSIPFTTIKTRTAQFFTSTDETVDVKMMNSEPVLLNYYESSELDAQFLEVPFQGKDASLTIVLPNQKEGIALLEKQSKLVFATPRYSVEAVEVLLPKFKIESTIDFKPILEKLGMRAAFDPVQADFSGIAGDPGDIVISGVKQKTFIDVNEGGVEAAAATAVTVERSASVPAERARKIIVDHPFAFYIKVNGVILFEGRVLEPHY